MTKKFTLFLVIITALFSFFPSVQASALTKAEQYDAALSELQNYFNGENEMTLDELIMHFDSLGLYKMSVSLTYYTTILMNIEKADYGRVYQLIDLLKKNADFNLFLEDDMVLVPLNDLEWYAKGREAEVKGRIDDAITYYANCLNCLDSMIRCERLETGALEAQYQEALDWYNMHTYEGYQRAYELFLSLGSYKESEAYLDKADTFRHLYGPTPSPTPRPTPKPTPIKSARVFEFAGINENSRQYTCEIEWKDSENNGPYTVEYSVESYSGTNQISTKVSAQKNTAVLQNIIPGEQYHIKISDRSGKSIETSISIRQPNSFRDGTFTSNLIMNHNYEIIYRYSHPTETTPSSLSVLNSKVMTNNVLNRQWHYYLSVRIGIPKLKESRQYNTMFVIRASNGFVCPVPLGMQLYTSNGTNETQRWHHNIAQDFFDKLCALNGQIPAGAYSVTLFWDGMKVKEGFFNIN